MAGGPRRAIGVRATLIRSAAATAAADVAKTAPPPEEIVVDTSAGFRPDLGSTAVVVVAPAPSDTVSSAVAPGGTAGLEAGGDDEASDPDAALADPAEIGGGVPTAAEPGAPGPVSIEEEDDDDPALERDLGLPPAGLALSLGLALGVPLALGFALLRPADAAALADAVDARGVVLAPLPLPFLDGGVAETGGDVAGAAGGASAVTGRSATCSAADASDSSPTASLPGSDAVSSAASACGIGKPGRSLDFPPFGSTSCLVRLRR